MVGSLLLVGTTLAVQGIVTTPIGTMPAAGAATNTVVSIEFDDGYANQYQTRSMLSAHGMHATFYIISGDHQLSWDQIHDLANDGNEIGGHTITHPDLTSLSTAEATHEVCDGRNQLIAQGFNNVTSFAYPYGKNNASVQQVVKNCGFTSGRDVSGIISPEGCGGPCPYAESIPPLNAYQTRTPQNVDEDTPLSEIQGFVTQAEQHGGGWVQLVFHDICSPGGSCDFYSMPPATFNTLLDWLQPRAANGTIVKTVGEVMGGSITPPPTPTLSVSKTGGGTGTVTSSPSGIDCGATCSASFDNGTGVTLTAAADPGSTFTGWSGGGCTGTGTCSVTVNADTTVTATFAAAPTGPYAPVVVADAPTGYWRLADTGTTAADAAGSNVGTYTGATHGAASLLGAEPGNAAAGFSGTNQYVRIPSATALSPTARVSVEAWMKPTSLPATGAFRSITSKAESYSLQFNGPRLEFTIIQGATRRRLQAPANAIVAGTTYHVVGTYDGTTQRLYVNGTQVASAALTGAIGANTNPLVIGSWNGSQEFFAGTIDEVAVYPAALSAARVSAHFQAGSGGAPPPTSTLTVSKAGTGTGTVTSSPTGINCGTTCAASFNNGTGITLTAAADPGSTFTGWSGGGCSGTGTCTLTLNTNTTVTATFGTAPPATSTLTVGKGGNGTGTVTSSPAGINCGATCAASFNNGTGITLTAAADSGSSFTGWSGGGCSGTGTCTLTLNANTTVTATFALLAPPTGYPQTVIGDTPAGYWRLDETSGTSAANSVATSGPGTYAGATLGVPGLIADAADRAVTLSGTNSRVQIASNTALSPTARVSVEAWIKPSALPATGAFNSIVSKAESYSLQFNGPRLEFTIIQGATRRRLQAPANAIVAGTTYHVVGTYDGTTQRLYVNGTQVASAALTGAINANTNALYIGSWNGTSEFFRGTVDEVAVYATALTATQVGNHRTAGTTP